MAETRTTYGANVIFFEGIFALYDQRILDLMDMKIFVDTDDDIRLARRCLHSQLFIISSFSLLFIPWL